MVQRPLLGILALAAAGAFRPQTVGDMDGRVTAERLAWELAASEGIALAVICPSFVLGPALDRDLGASAEIDEARSVL